MLWFTLLHDVYSWVVGVCPQHDVLLPELTVRKSVHHTTAVTPPRTRHGIVTHSHSHPAPSQVAEHLYFFAGIKGCPPENMAGEVDRLVKSVGLTEKRDVQARFLSGGQKRKLSVAIAFIGDSKIVILGKSG